MVVVEAKDNSKALVGGGPDRRHRRIAPARREDWIGCVSRCRRLPFLALDQRLLHAYGNGGVETCARAEAVVAQQGCSDLEQWRTAMGAGCRAPGEDERRKSRPPRGGRVRPCFPGRTARGMATARRRRLLLDGQPSRRLLLPDHRRARAALIGWPGGCRNMDKVWRGVTVGEVRLSIELCAVYWHFLLLVWLVFFSLLLLTDPIEIESDSGLVSLIYRIF